MSRFNHHREITTSGYVYRALVAIAGIALLVFFMPRGSRTHYDFSIGKPWYDSPIIAKETFPLLKSDSLLRAERQQAQASYKPIYEMSADMGREQMKNFVSRYNTTLSSSIPFYYRLYVTDKLKEVYDAGILPAEDYDRLKLQNCKAITISTGNEGRTQALGELFTPKTAYEHIVYDKDSLRYRPSVLQRCDISNYIRTNLTYDKLRSESLLESLQKSISLYRGEVQAGQEIVHRGQIVDEQTYLALRSMETFYKNGQKQSKAERLSLAIGQVLYASIIVLCLLVFFNQFRSDYLQQVRTVLLVVLMILFFPLLTYTLVKHGISAYIVPYCILPIFLRVFLDSRTAFITHVCSILLSAIAVSYPFEFTVTQLVAGLVAIYSMKLLSQRSELFRAVIFVTLASMICHLCFDLINMAFFSTEGITPMLYLYILVNGVILLISYTLLIPFERIFRFTSNVTLVELSNTNNEILRRLSEEAPGTFQHSMQVANLAAEVANKLGAKSQLVRTGALYHDIGKIEDAVFYTENQSGTQNPHDNLTYVHSAQLIIGHVQKGLALAEKYKLPPVIREFISTHHGTSKTKYFYVSYKNAHPDEPIDEQLFSYPGPNPSTLEQAILMMADSVEAASRSLKEYTEESVSELVGRIIDSQVAEGYFNHCPITFEDISTAKQVFCDKLMTIYHTRISYPELKKEEKA